MYYGALTDDERYVHSIYEDMIRAMMRELNNKLYIECEDRVVARDADDRPVRTMRHATLTVLVPEGTDDDGDT